MRNLIKPTPPGRIILTDRDKQILWRAHEFRFITTNQIERFTGSKSRSKLNMRLRDLWGADYLTRPEIQRSVYAYREKRETVHALGQRGAEWLAQEHGAIFPKGKGFEAANRIKSGTFLEHEVGVADLLLGFSKALGAYPGFRIIDQSAVVREVEAKAERRLKYPLTMPSTIRWPSGKIEKAGTKADYTCFLADERAETPRRALLFWEYENTKKDSAKILAKYLKYIDIFRRGVHEQRFGRKLFRVLIVLNEEPVYLNHWLTLFQRKIASQHRVPPSLFLHITLSEFWRAGPASDSWLDAGGSRASVIPAHRN